MKSKWPGIFAGTAAMVILYTPSAASAVSRPVSPPQVRATTACRVADTIPVGRDPRGVAVNPRTNTVYVANVQDATVSSVSGRTHKVTGTIDVSAFSLALDPKTAMIYATNASEEGQVAVVNARLRKVVATVDVGPIPLFAAADPRT